MQDPIRKTRQLSPNVWLSQDACQQPVIIRILPAGQYPVYETLQQARIQGLPVIYQLNSLPNQLEVAEEYIPGPSLLEKMAQASLSEQEILDTMDALCTILSQVHDLGLVHRDLKPEHIIFSPGGIRLIDFGIARQARPDQTQDTQLLGTPGYAAPEQYGFGSSDAQSDIYALGCILEDMDSTKRFGRCVKRAKALNKKDRYRCVSAFQRDLHARSLVIPGFNNRTRIARALSWFYLLISLGAAANMPAANSPFHYVILYKVLGFLFLYAPFFLAQNTHVFSFLPGGGFRAVRWIYAAGLYLFLLVTVILLFTTVDLIIP